MERALREAQGLGYKVCSSVKHLTSKVMKKLIATTTKIGLGWGGQG